MAERKKFYLTKQGLRELKKEYEALKKLRIAKTQDRVPEILESEDLNPEYLSFREDLNLLEARLSELGDILKDTVLIGPPSKEKTSFVNLGAKVTVQVDGERDEFEIVGTLEANPALGRISNESPVGLALLGHKAGEEVVVSSPIKTIYKIKKIRYS